MPSAAFEHAVIRKISWRIIPLCFVLYTISYVNRASLGYAALQMNRELALSSEAFGFAAGIFFIGYFLFEVPSNVALLRYGPRRWIARILISWGMVSALTAFVQTATQLYILRFLLGVAEAGFFPGIIIYLTYWFRAREQASTLALFTAAIPVSYLIGAPISTFLMDHASGLGFSGWRWMLFLESLPAILGGFITLLILTDTPDEARWLNHDERAWIKAEICRSEPHRALHLRTWQTMINPRVLYLSAIYFVYQCGSLAVGYWLPTVIKQFSRASSNFEIGLIAIIPYAVATIGMVLWSRHSDRSGERRSHAALPLLVSALTLGGLAFTASALLSLVLISLSLTGLYAFKAPFWTLPGLFLSRDSAAISIAVINSIGNLGGFAGPYLVGLVADLGNGPMVGLATLSAAILIAAIMTWRVRLGIRNP